MSFVLVTGANGFVGKALLTRLQLEGKPVRGVVRHEPVSPGCSIGPEVDGHSDWSGLLAGCDAVIHCAARVHMMNESATDPLAAFRAVNVAGTVKLARQAAAAGVRRFVFVSSVKVNGEQTAPGRPFTAEDEPAPRDPYGASKHEAEVGLREIEKQTGMEVVIVRPPLVYGPGVRANFAAMMKWLRRGLPLPLGGVTSNRRSLVALDNLVDLLVLCLRHPAAAGRTFMVSDGEDVSTAELLRRLGQALGRPARLLSISPILLHGMARAVGRGGAAQRLCGSLQVDITSTRQLLGWVPPVSLDEGLRRAANAMVSQYACAEKSC